MAGLDSNTKLLLQAGNYQDDTLVPDGTLEVIDSSGTSAYEGLVVTQQGSATLIPNNSYFGETAIYFDGTSRYELADSADWTLGSNWTIDYWANYDSFGQKWTAGQWTHPDSSWMINVNDATGVQFAFVRSPSGNDTTYSYYMFDGTNRPVAGQWMHCAWVNTNNTLHMYLNGVEATIGGQAIGSIRSSTHVLQIGGVLGAGMAGYLQEFRLSDNVRWTTGFDATALTQHTPDSNTILLIHGEAPNDAVNSSTVNSHTVSRISNAGTNAVFGSAGASFDGTGDYLEVESKIDMHDIHGSSGNDWTIDCWAFHNQTTSSQVYLAHYESATYFWQWYWSSSGNLMLALKVNGSNAILMNSSGNVINPETWQHITLKKLKNIHAAYVDGLMVDSLQDSSVSSFALNTAWEVGAMNAADEMDGKFDEFRVQKSNAFDVVIPYAYYKCADNAANTTVGDIGYGSNDGTTLANNTSTFTSTSTPDVLDGRSLYINGTQNNIIKLHGLAADVTNDTEGSMSFWFNLTAITNKYMFGFGHSASPNNMWLQTYVNTAGDTVNADIFSTSAGTTAWSISSPATWNGTATWNHFALVHDGVQATAYLNGSSNTALTITTTPSAWFAYLNPGVDEGWLGSRPTYNAPSAPFSGGFDDVRYYKTALNSTQVQALYLGKDFIVPTAAHTQDVNTKLLMHFDSQDNSFEGRNS